jgi:hypothetical protein
MFGSLAADPPQISGMDFYHPAFAKLRRARQRARRHGGLEKFNRGWTRMPEGFKQKQTLFALFAPLVFELFKFAQKEVANSAPLVDSTQRQRAVAEW